MNVIEIAIKGYETEKIIDSMDNKVVKGMAIDILNAKFNDRTFRRSDLTMKEARNVLYSAVMIDGYEI